MKKCQPLIDASGRVDLLCGLRPAKRPAQVLEAAKGRDAALRGQGAAPEQRLGALLASGHTPLEHGAPQLALAIGSNAGGGALEQREHVGRVLPVHMNEYRNKLS